MQNKTDKGQTVVKCGKKLHGLKDIDIGIQTEIQTHTHTQRYQRDLDMFSRRALIGREGGNEHRLKSKETINDTIPKERRKNTRLHARLGLYTTT